MKDYYQILGVEKTATKDEIKSAFRKLAHKYHPDKAGGDEAKFKEASEAYAVLSDDKKRSEYDTYGRVFNGGGGASGGQGFGGFNGDFSGFDFSQFTGGSQFQDFDLGDIFGDIFGGGGSRTKTKRGNDITVDIELTFKDSIFGTEKKINLTKHSTCEHCKGSGAEKNSDFSTCSTCGGSGKVQEVKRSFLGSFASVRTCEKCKGTGKIPKVPCGVCRGAGILRKNEEITINVPAGIENGQAVRIMGYGEAVSGGTTGDLYVRVHVRAHETFEKEGSNLIAEITVKLSDALLGGEYKLETLEGPLTVKIPEGITHGEILRIKGKGVPHGSKRGDLLLHVRIHIPHKLSKEARKKIEELKNEGL